MPISVYYKNEASQVCTLRPSPLVSIGSTLNKVGGETVGVTYVIELTGTILEDRGSPYALKAQDNTPFNYFDSTVPTGIGPYGQFDNSSGHSEDNRPKVQPIPENAKLDAIFSKQRAIKALFAMDGQRLEIMPVHGDEPAIICFPRVTSVSFEEGQYINRCNYTITLEADTLLNKNLTLDEDGNPVEESLKPALVGANDGMTTVDVINSSGSFIQEFSEDWSIEVDEERAEGLNRPRSYIITRNISATGKRHHFPSGNEVKTIEAWESAKNFVVQRLIAPDSGIYSYPNSFPFQVPNEDNQIGSGTLNLINAYGGYNHTRTESVDRAGGSFSVTETFLLASGSAYENYDMQISQGLDNAFVSVSINGTVTGLDQIVPSGYDSGSGTIPVSGTRYDNALKKYNLISNSGQFGLISDIYRRANSNVMTELNAQPRSVSLGVNEFDGEITYALEFDNRPSNIISGVLSESISVNDSYPGDVFAVIPVIGRATGPVMQYIGTRTEYKRDVSLDLQMDYTDIFMGSGRRLLTQKPSVVEPTKSQIRNLIKDLSPEDEPGIRKYFVSSPQESWSPKTGTYSFKISWTYELDS